MKQDAKVLDELVFDVNTAYFERHGRYQYAKEFFEKAYRLAVKEAGGEPYILSAVMHADERSGGIRLRCVSLSSACDIFPRGSKRDQVVKTLQRPGTGWHHSLLHDRFIEHTQAAGYHGFECGERGKAKILRLIQNDAINQKIS